MSVRDEILARLDSLGLPYELHSHAPVPASTDRYPMGLTFDAVVCKNLLLTVRNKSRYYLVMMPAEKSADLRAAARALGSARLCFAEEEDALRLLGESKGVVGPSGLVRDADHVVRMVFDGALRDRPRVAMHPGVNTETLVMTFDDLAAFVRACGNEVLFYDF